MRIKAVISYDGSRYFGFQTQKHTKQTVADTIEAALKTLGISSRITGSGRTDTGVHATGQVIHFDIPDYWKEIPKLKKTLNRMLYPGIKIKHLCPTDEHFHARHSTKRRVYRYVMSTKEPNPFQARFVTFRSSLDIPKIKETIRLFEGRHDFSYFMKTGSDFKHFVRTITKARCYCYKDFVILLFEADGFVRSQVRMMVDFLLKISDGKLTAQDLKDQLNLKKRVNTDLAPAEGLYLARVIY